MMNSIKNSIINVDLKTLETIIKSIKNSNVYIVKIKGEMIQCWEDYIFEIQNKFNFPTSCLDSVDRYLDWMRDLQWIIEEKIVLVIYNYKCFLRNNTKLKNELILDFKEVILPYWEGEVKAEVVEGVPRSHTIYLVD